MIVFCFVLISTIFGATLAQDVNEFGFVDFDMLVYRHDRDERGFASVRVQEDDCSPDLVAAFPLFTAIDMERQATFSFELAPSKFITKPYSTPATPYPPYIDFPEAKINLALGRIDVELPDWIFLDQGIDVTSCKPDVVKCNAFTTAKFSYRLIERNNTVLSAWKVYPIRKMLIPSLTDFNQIVVNFESDNVSSNALLNGSPIVDTCPNHIEPQKLSWHGYWSKMDFTLNNFFIDKDGTRIISSSTLVYELGDQHSGKLPVDLDKLKELGQKYCQDPTCLPYYIAGPEFRRADRCLIRCRPSDPAKRHRPDLCPQIKPLPPMTLDVICSITLNGNDVGNLNSLLADFPTNPDPIVFQFRCRIPYDQRYAIVACQDDPTSFCDPSLMIFKDRAPIYEANTIRAKMPDDDLESPADVVIDMLNLTGSGFYAEWASGKVFPDRRFIDFTFPLHTYRNDLAARSAEKFKLNGTYKFVLVYRNDEKLAKLFKETIIAEINIFTQNTTLSKEQTSRSIYYSERYMDNRTTSFQLDCDFYQTNLPGPTVWQKSIKGTFFTRDEISVMDSSEISPEMAAFLERTKVVAADDTLRLVFDFSRVPPSEVDEGFYRCVNAAKRLRHHFNLNIVRPFHCDSHLATRQGYEIVSPLSSYGVSFLLDTKFSNNVTVGLVCQPERRSLAVCSKQKLCNPTFVLFRDTALVYSSLDDPNNNFDYNYAPFKEDLLEIRLKHAFLPLVRYTLAASFGMPVPPEPVDVITEPGRFDQLVLTSDEQNNLVVKRRNAAKGADVCRVVIGENFFAYSLTDRLILNIQDTTRINATFVCKLGREDPIKRCDSPEAQNNPCDPVVSLAVISKTNKIVKFYDSKNGYVKPLDADPKWSAVKVFFDINPTDSSNQISVTLAFFQDVAHYPHYFKLSPKILDEISGAYLLEFAHQNITDRPFRSEIPLLNVTIRQSPQNVFEKKCRRSLPGFEYVGHVARTVCGDVCLPWLNSKWLQTNSVDASIFPDLALHPSGSEARNYCRNPTMEPSFLFCPLADVEGGRGFCHVPMCDEMEEFILERYERFYGPCDCEHVAGERLVRRPVTDFWERFRKCNGPKQYKACRDFKALEPYYKRSFLEIDVSSQEECADFCDQSESCQGFNLVAYGKDSTRSYPYQCQLKKCSCEAVACDSSSRGWYYQKRDVYYNMSYDEEPPFAESFSTHVYQPGARAITITCQFLDSTPDLNRQFAIWEKLEATEEPMESRFIPLPRTRFGRSKTTYHGFYLYFDDHPLNEKDGGLYRCSLNGSYEYHQIIIQHPLECRMFGNGTLIRKTRNINKFEFSFGGIEDLPFFVDIVCDFSVRGIDVCGDDNPSVSCNPFVELKRENDVINDGISFQSVKQNRFRVQIKLGSEELEIENLYSLEVFLVPKPIPNTMKTMDTFVMTDIIPVQFYNQFPLFVAGVDLQPWPDRPRSNIFPLSYKNVHFELRIEPGSFFTVFFVIQLVQETARFCNVKAGCYPITVTLFQKAMSPMKQDVSDLSISTEPFSNVTNLPIKFGAYFKSPRTVEVAMHFSPNIPDLDLQRHRQELAGVYVLLIKVGDDFVENLQTIQMSVEVKTTPSHFTKMTQLSPDCYRQSNSSGYDGRLTVTACLRASCIFWPRQPIEIDKNFCRAQPGINSSNPWCWVQNLKTGAHQKDVCDIPSCSAFSDNTLGGRYDRYVGQCLKCPGQLDFPERTTTEDCQYECDRRREKCTGFSFRINPESEKAECSLTKLPCSCSDDDLTRNCGDSPFFQYYYKKRNNSYNIWFDLPKDFSKIYISHADQGKPEFLQEKTAFSSSSSVWNFTPSSGSPKIGSLPKGVKISAKNGVTTLSLKDGGVFNRSYEGVYSSLSAPSYLNIVKMVDGVICDVSFGNVTMLSSRTPWPTYTLWLGFYVWSYSHNVLIKCDLSGSGRQIGYCNRGGSSSGVCNPKVAVLDRKRGTYGSYVYKSWPSKFVPQKLLVDISLEVLNPFSFQLILKDVAKEPHVVDFRYYVVTFRFTPSSQTQLVVPLVNADESDEDMLPIDLNSRQFSSGSQSSFIPFFYLFLTALTLL